MANSVYFCEHLGDEACVELGSEAFMQRLKVTPYKQLLAYIHGFSNMPAAVLEAAGEFQALCDQRKPGEVLVIPFIWPCDDDFGIMKDYWDDQKAADASSFAFARVLEKFNRWRNSAEFNPAHDPCRKRINVLAHSMGNRVLRGTLEAWSRYDLGRGGAAVVPQHLPGGRRRGQRDVAPGRTRGAHLPRLTQRGGVLRLGRPGPAL